MTIDDLRTMLHRRPFIPFRLIPAGGREINITSPDAIAWEDDNPRLIVVMADREFYRLDPGEVTYASGIRSTASKPETPALTSVLRQYVAAKPFRPFRLVMRSGGEIPVPAPECIKLGDDGITADVRPGDGTWHMVDLRHLVGIRS
jgi:hypothetical protein